MSCKIGAEPNAYCFFSCFSANISSHDVEHIKKMLANLKGKHIDTTNVLVKNFNRRYGMYPEMFGDK